MKTSGRTPDLTVLAAGQPFTVGDSILVWDETDANANNLKLDLPTGDSTDIPVLSIGIGTDGVDLGFFNGITMPAVAVVDADRDSAVRLGFVADDRPAILMHGSAGLLEIATGLILGTDEGEITAPAGVTLRAPDIAAGGVGDIAGADITVAAGLGTGTGDVGTIIFSTPRVAAAGDNIQALTILAVMDAANLAMQDNQAVGFGTSVLSRMYNDGTDTFLDLRASGTGDLMIALAGSFPSPDPDTVHIWVGTAGAVTAFATTQIVLESNDSTHISFLVPDGLNAGIIIGSPTDGNNRANFQYNGAGDYWAWRIDQAERLHYSANNFAFQEATEVSTSTGVLTIDGDDGVVLKITGSGGIESRNTLILGTQDGQVTARTGETLRASDAAAGGAGDIPGADLSIAAGLGTGVGDAGTIIFQLPIVAGVGDFIQTRAARLTLDMLASTTVLTMAAAQALTISSVAGDLTLNPAGNVVMGADVFIQHDTNATLTAGTTQTQADGLALTTEVNEIATVANPNDTVVLPAAVAGRKVTIINSGDNTLRMYPLLGDNLGAGVDVFEELEPNEVIDFVAYDGTNWHVESSTEILHAEMFDSDNGVDFDINSGDGDDHGYRISTMAAGDLAGWTFDVGGANAAKAIASIADGADSGNDIEVTTSTDHGFAAGDIVVHTDSTSLANAAYVGHFVVKAIISTVKYEVAAVFGITGTGFTAQPATLKANAGSAGQYQVNWYASAAIVGANDNFDFALHVQTTHITSTNTRRFFSANDVGSLSGGSIIAIADGDQVSFTVVNASDAGNIIMRDFVLMLVRL